jgi:ATP-dependent exoDNAse (exonuclease V) beta subunit
MTRAEEHLVLSFAMTASPKGKNWKLVRDGLGLALDEADNRSLTVAALKREQVAEPRASASGLPANGIPVRVLRTDQTPDPLSVPATPSVMQAEALVLARPTLSDQHDSSSPVTSVQLFAQCPRRYYLGRYIGWDRMSRPVETHADEAPRDWDEPHDERAAEFGTRVHALLAGEPVDNPSAEALDLVQRFQTSELGQRVARASRVEREFDFVMAIEDVVLRGQIDLWFEEGDDLLLVDYKTDNVRPEEAASRAAAYALQLRLYALALERITGRLPNRVYAHFLRLGLTIPIATDKPSLDEAKHLVRLFREAQSSLRFDLREGEQCGKCAYHRGLCREGLPAASPYAGRL